MRFSSRHFQISLVLLLLSCACCFGGGLRLSENGILRLAKTDEANDYSFLAHFDTDFSVLAPASYTISTTGTPVIVATNAIGIGSLYCTPALDTYVDYSALKTISGDCDLSFWLYIDLDANYGWVVRGGNFNLYRGELYGTPDPKTVTWNADTYLDTPQGNEFSYTFDSDNTWYNVRFKKLSNVISMYVDGVEVASVTPSVDVDLGSLKFGGYIEYFDGVTLRTGARVYVDEPMLVEGSFDALGIDYQIEQNPIIINGKLALSGASGLPPITDYIAWYDAADTSTITDIAGAVQTWADKSGNSYNATKNITAPTTASDSLNGLNVISFNNDGMDMPTGVIPAGNASYTICAVWKVGGNDQTLIGVGDALADSAVYLYIDATGNHQHDWWANGDEVAGVATNTMLSIISFDGAERYTECNDVIATDTPTGKTTGTTVARLGSLLNFSSYSLNNGYIAEVLIYHRGLSGAEITQTETYLKSKWGL